MYQSPLEYYSSPDLIKVSNKIYALSFKYMKVPSVKFVIDKLILENKIDPTIHELVETSSGTYAMSLAIVSKQMKLKSTIIIDGSVDENFRMMLKALGTKVIKISDNKLSQNERIDFTTRYISEQPETRLWLNQYDSPEHSEGYEAIGKFIAGQLGAVQLVGAVGSGASTSGIYQGLSDAEPDTKLIGIDLVGSVIFGGENGIRDISGIGSAIVPKNVNHNLYDRVHYLSSTYIKKATLDLIKETALFFGYTSGAGYLVSKYESLNSELPIVFICPDMKERYDQQLRKSFKTEGFESFDFGLPDIVSCAKHVCSDWSIMRLK
ncbi:pyridoxal-phosphate dependent enzyme [Photobacterium sp. WH77]|uniref:pyridoxal-phosphate dependent enzyme n=1 Tax=unclassified Photobacterium TaxID=2628852 RepID=UPI001C46D1A2|nr:MULTISPECIES: pyridoxal-phosphate dependent enzyme [unclassified Photobacterium]MBV7262663.1 pyridoxal-phosphate dependent enzyme [Photobacterium sp. WH24]MCG2837792.1 pyridoxal-phosphate dependent enzyme [Photobacterium sp. WH77]MCG2845408.1 pyridoxal-phosphate dependent enzyme [Photobacterium sp. WH80]MDO6582190.1 pyridoxal-phosphate dependent enzyme [Photobacterium sp. 2_MG-2023]